MTDQFDGPDAYAYTGPMGVRTVEMIPVRHWSRRLFRPGTFTRSNGTISSRIYERLTKASRRRDPGPGKNLGPVEEAYRRGVFDAIEALRKEISTR